MWRSLPAVADTIRKREGWLDAPGILNKEIVGAQCGLSLKLGAKRLGLEGAVANSGSRVEVVGTDQVVMTNDKGEFTIAKLPSDMLEPEFGTAIGMVLYGHRARQARMNLDRGLGARIKALFARQGA